MTHADAAACIRFHNVFPLCTERPAAPAQKVLLVGNSLMFYNCGVSSMLSELSKSLGHPMTVTMAAIGGASLSWHDVKSYLRPNGLRSYRITADNRFEFLRYPDGKIFDAVLMVDSTQGPIHPELKASFETYAARHCRDIRASGAEPLLMVSWGYRNVPGMTEKLADSIISAANANRCRAVPCGIAFERAREARPDLELIRTDNRHPTVAGTFLEAAVFFAALTGMDPRGSAYCGRFDDLKLAPDDAAFLRQAAWDAVCSFYGWEA